MVEAMPLVFLLYGYTMTSWRRTRPIPPSWRCRGMIVAFLSGTGQSSPLMWAAQRCGQRTDSKVDDVGFTKDMGSCFPLSADYRADAACIFHGLRTGYLSYRLSPVAFPSDQIAAIARRSRAPRPDPCAEALNAPRSIYPWHERPASVP
jgi:hypothetical protein